METTMAAKVVICILAHNEEKHISETVQTLIDSSKKLKIPIHIYANSCNDRTVEICLEIAKLNPLIFLRTIDIASKIHAWNCAFHELSAEYIIFCDGDIIS